MSVASEITRIQQAKENIKLAIINKGVAVSSTATLDTYASKIDEISGGGGDDREILIDLIEKDITSINIPQGTTKIGDYTFYQCSGLTNVTIPNSVTSIGNNAFTYCKPLTSITIGNSVISIGSQAFYQCSGLTSIELPNSITNIGNNAFDNCSSLTSVTIPNSLTSINTGVFSGCSKLTSIEIPNSVTSIGDYAFSYCRGFTSVTIPNSVTSIGSNAFQNCSGLTSIELPKTVTTIGTNAFINTKNLSNVYCSWLIPPSTGAWFSNSYTGGTLHIPNGASQYYSQKWTGSTAPLGTTLHWNLVEDQGDYIPKNRLSLKYNITSTTSATKLFGGTNKFASGATSAATGSTIWIEDTPSMFSGSGYTFSSVGVKEVYVDSCPSAIPSAAFSAAITLTEVTIPNNVTSIGYSGFSNCSSLTSVTIPDSVTSIGNSAFENCSSFTSITIPNSVTTIGDSAIRNCSSLSSIEIPNSVTTIGGRAFYTCSSLTSVTIPNSVEYVDKNAFDGTPWYNSYSADTKNRYNNVIYIGYCAYRRALTTMSSCVIKDGTKSLGNGALYSCKSLTNVTIPNSVTRFGDYALQDCTKLGTVNYNGTSAQFTLILRGAGWKQNVPSTCIIRCTDGDFPIGNFA